ncbi:flagellar basal body-associated FliL family protein [Azohydromonas caseinilytica]|uniref:Flagellar protein FliL n=1 Tax=Azohydromonas caseinilytica TaxID=2728836 RepID=A0A848F9E5_9BURK|nr:flagellar basal body-associated FliL family protein [Azohydromonas caseinilytica]NML14860.1 flagellar basal body rod protein [Azohydromonas caseinilytica]
MSAAVAALGASLKKGRIKIVLIAAAVLLLLGGGAAYLINRSMSADDEEVEVEVQDAPEDADAEQYDPRSAPVFVQLEVFTVNLADRDTDRFAQVGVTLEVEDQKAVEQIKAFMPVIRNNILLVLSNKSSASVRDEPGKRRLAAELRAQALRPLGYEVNPDDLVEEPAPGASAPAGSRPRKPRRLMALPIKAVHFSNFIVQ